MMSFSVRGGTKLLSINQISNGSGTKYNEKRYKKHATIIIFSLSQNPNFHEYSNSLDTSQSFHKLSMWAWSNSWSAFSLGAYIKRLIWLCPSHHIIASVYTCAERERDSKFNHKKISFPHIHIKPYIIYVILI